MDIIFVRHGSTEENRKKVYGSSDIHLSEKGKTEVLNIKNSVNNMSFGKVYISPLKRTMETSKILGVKGIHDDRIKEINFSIFGGKTYEEIKKIYPEEVSLWTKDYINYRIPGGESLKDIYERTKDFLENIISENKNVLVITHEGVIRCALCWVFDNMEYFYRFRADNGSITVISADDGYKYIKCINKR